MSWLLLITSLVGQGPSLPYRLALYEPCPGMLPASPAVAAARSLGENRLDLELVHTHSGLQGFLQLRDGAVEAVVVHSLGSAKMVVAACYPTRAQRDDAMRWLRTTGQQERLGAQPWEWITERRTLYLVGIPRARWLRDIGSPRRLVYLHLEGEPPTELTPGGFYRLQADTPCTLDQGFILHHFLLRKLALPSQLPARSGGEVPSAVPDLWIQPHTARVCAPATLPLVVHNASAAPSPPLTLMPLLGHEGLEVALEPPLLLVEPGQSAPAQLSVTFNEHALAGRRRVALELAGNLPSKHTYARYWEVNTVIDRPPLISGPTSALFAPGREVHLNARDPDLMTVHMEALVPSGLQASVAGGRVTITFPRWEAPKIEQPHLRVLAWSGPEREASRLSRHDVVITGTQGHPRPWLATAVWGIGLLVVLLGGLRELLRRWMEPQAASMSKSSR